MGVLESLLGVLDLSHSLLDALLLIGLFFEHGSLDVKFALKLGGLGVEPVVEGHPFAQVGVLPYAEGKSTDDSSALKHSHLLVEGHLVVDIGQADLPNLETKRDREEHLHLAVILLEGSVLAKVFLLAGVIRGEVKPQIVHVLH